MQTHDVSAQPKTGKALLQLVIEDIKWSEETYGLTIIAACSDDGGNAHNVAVTCHTNSMAYHHYLLGTSIALIVSDYLSLKLPFQDCV